MAVFIFSNACSPFDMQSKNKCLQIYSKLEFRFKRMILFNKPHKSLFVYLNTTVT
ncbi:hypothetical protein HanXRQr2_Chr05g0193231 [Helianthus annuus]|uniref:Uncharacterized protein n=1 Tax=Helianthus annuus TaxID=4232 RepID=A0A9K3NKX9_HELAN|nr:hypothetical protein HanXRQr2_Chr05g0193231 [Helianthus annuus]